MSGSETDQPPTPFSPRDVGDLAEQDQENSQEEKELLEEILEMQSKAKQEREEIQEAIPAEKRNSNVFTLPDILRSVVLAGILVGIVGLLASVILQATIYAPIFIIGLLFLFYAEFRGIQKVT